MSLLDRWQRAGTWPMLSVLLGWFCLTIGGSMIVGGERGAQQTVLYRTLEDYADAAGWGAITLLTGVALIVGAVLGMPRVVRIASMASILVWAFACGMYLTEYGLGAFPFWTVGTGLLIGSLMLRFRMQNPTPPTVVDLARTARKRAAHAEAVHRAG